MILDILADHARQLSRSDSRSVVEHPVYQERSRKVAEQSFGFGGKIFNLTKAVRDGDLSAETELYRQYSSLLSEIYWESIDVADLMTSLPDDVRSFLLGCPESYESLPQPRTDFTITANPDLSSEEGFFDERIQTVLEAITNLMVRALAVKYTTCHRTLIVRINTHIRDLAKLAMELIRGRQMILLFGASHLAVARTRQSLQEKFYDEAGTIRILEYMGEGKMFSDDRLEKDEGVRKIIELMTGGLFDFDTFRLP
ncbi:MAG: hypothetical protein WD187_00500 [Candidatus Woykebacteria bacterium]